MSPRIFVYEYLCGPAGLEGSESLHREGWAMLAAVLDDLGRCDDYQITTLLSHRPLPQSWQAPTNLQIERAQPHDEEAAFRRLAQQADYTWLIVPEFDDLLYRRALWTEELGSTLLGPSPAAIRRTADKLELSHHLTQHGISTPLTEPWPPRAVTYPLVCKPRFGAGSQATFLIENEHELQSVAERALAEAWTGPLIGQPYIPGLAASVAFLIGPKQRFALPAAQQLISTDGRFHCLGGRCPLAPDLNCRAFRLAERAMAAVEGLNGYIGVDLVLGDIDAVIEINPRLTTSYVGLRRLTERNLAGTMVQIVRGEHAPDLNWNGQPVEFRAEA